MNSFSYTLKTKRLFLLVVTTVSFTKHNGNHSENMATFCNISVWDMTYSGLKRRCSEARIHSCQLTLSLEHLTLQIHASFPHISEYGTQIILLKWLPHVQLFTCLQKRVLSSPPISRWSLSSVYNFFLFLLVLCLQHERTFSSAYISQVFSACPKHTWRHIFSSSSNLQTAHTDSFSDDFLTVFVVMVAKLKLPISREEVHKKRSIK